MGRAEHIVSAKDNELFYSAQLQKIGAIMVERDAKELELEVALDLVATTEPDARQSVDYRRALDIVAEARRSIQFLTAEGQAIIRKIDKHNKGDL